MSLRKHHTTIWIEFLSRSPVSNMIWFAGSDSTQIRKFNLTQYFLFESPFPNWLNKSDYILLIISFFNLNQFSHLIWLPIQLFDSPFTIQLRFSDSIWISYPKFYLTHTLRIWIIIYDSAQVFWFNLTNYFWFNLTQSSNLI